MSERITIAISRQIEVILVHLGKTLIFRKSLRSKGWYSLRDTGMRGPIRGDPEIGAGETQGHVLCICQDLSSNPGTI